VHHTEEINYINTDFSVGEEQFKVVLTGDFSNHHFLFDLEEPLLWTNRQAEKSEEEKVLEGDDSQQFSFFSSQDKCPLDPCYGERPI